MHAFKSPPLTGDPDQVESFLCNSLSSFVSCTGKTIILTQTIPDSLTKHIPAAVSRLSEDGIVVITTSSPLPASTSALTTSPLASGPNTPPSPSPPIPVPGNPPETPPSQNTASSAFTGDSDSATPTSGQSRSSNEMISPTAPLPMSQTLSITSSELSGANATTPVTSADVDSLPATPSPIPVTQTPESTRPQQALVSTHSSKAGPIAGGVIGGLFLLAVLLLLLLYRKKIASRLRRKHRVAPSAEFLNAGTRAVSPRDGAFVGAGRITPHQRAMSMHEGSRAGSPYVAQRLGSSLSMRGNEEGMAGMAGVGIGTLGLAAVGEGSAPPDEPPPPFSRGNFNDPLVEKLNDAARQRQELYRAAVSPGFAGRQQDLEAGSFAYANSPTPLTIPSSVPYVLEDSSSSSASHGRQDSDTTRTSHQGVFNKSAYDDPFHESDSEEDMKNTSPMLNPSKVSRLSMQVEADSRTRKQSQAGEIGWAV